MAVKLLIGLGNPGDKYLFNRHNAGFMAVDAIAEAHRFGPWKRRFQGWTAEAQVGAHRVILLKSATYMNESGRAAGEAMRFYKLTPADVTVFHDELDLEPGKLRVKAGGGHAGHNGLKSLSAHIGNDYRRVRIGIGHPGNKAEVANYVLRDFAKSDQDWLAGLLTAIAQAMPKLIDGQDASFMNEVARLVRGDAKSSAQPAAAAPTPAKPETAPAAAVVAGASLDKQKGAFGALASWLHGRIRGGVD
jgi:PTH1 family peptidyl-tRNA hydrolase